MALRLTGRNVIYEIARNAGTRTACGYPAKVRAKLIFGTAKPAFGSVWLRRARCHHLADSPMVRRYLRQFFRQDGS